MTVNKERLAYLKDYLENDKVKVAFPVYISQTSKGTVHYYFEGLRFGYTFKHGFSMVDKKDLFKFKEAYPNIIIHDNNKGENN
jgi:hypothetical protein